MYANIKPLLLGKKKQRFFAILASPEGEAVGGPARRLMRGKSAIVTRLRAATTNPPLIRSCGATFPQGGRLKIYFYIVSGAVTLNIVRMLWMTPRTARQSAMRPC